MTNITSTVKMKKMSIIKNGVLAQFDLASAGGASVFSLNDSYEANSIVTLNGVFYKALKTTTGVNPETDLEEEYWRKLVPVHSSDSEVTDEKMEPQYMYGVQADESANLVTTPVIPVQEYPSDEFISPKVLYSVDEATDPADMVIVTNTYPEDSNLLVGSIYLVGKEVKVNE